MCPIVPVILIMVWMVQHHSVRVSRLANCNSNCTWLWRVICPKIHVMIPSVNRHRLLLIIPKGLVMIRMIKHCSMRTISLSYSYPFGAWNFIWERNESHVMLPTINIHCVLGIIPVGRVFVWMIDQTSVRVSRLANSKSSNGRHRISSVQQMSRILSKESSSFFKFLFGSNIIFILDVFKMPADKFVELGVFRRVVNTNKLDSFLLICWSFGALVILVVVNTDANQQAGWGENGCLGQERSSLWCNTVIVVIHKDL